MSSNAPGSEPIDPIRPLSQERLIELFDKEGWHYAIDDDGDLGGRWDNSVFYFIIAGGSDKDILHITSQMREEIPLEALDEFLVFIEDWHRDTIWPKAYHTFQEDGSLRLSADLAIHWGHGATDEQLLLQVNAAIGTSGQLYNAVRERFGIAPIEE